MESETNLPLGHPGPSQVWAKRWPSAPPLPWLGGGWLLGPSRASPGIWHPSAGPQGPSWPFPLILVKWSSQVGPCWGGGEAWGWLRVGGEAAPGLAEVRATTFEEQMQMQTARPCPQPGVSMFFPCSRSSPRSLLPPTEGSPSPQVPAQSSVVCLPPAPSLTFLLFMLLKCSGPSPQRGVTTKPQQH